MISLLLAAPVASLGDDPPAPDPLGRWKLTADRPMVGEFAILDLKAERGILSAKVVAIWPIFSKPRAYVARSADALVLLVTQEDGYGDMVFKAVLPKGDADRIPGAFQFRVDEAPIAAVASAKLERTRDGALPKPKPALPEDEPGVAAELGALLARGKPLSELRDKRYAALDLQVALAAEADLRPDALTRSRAFSAARLAEAAARADRPKIADEARSRLATLKREVTEEDKPQRGPLVVEPFRGPRTNDEDRVVLVELFTGAWSSSCTADASSFDAVASAYRPSEVIAIQYHLHAAAPDPLANPDSIARHGLAQAGKAPLALFNGKAMAGGWVEAEHPRRKFNQYRGAIEAALKGPKRATIALKAIRDGDALTISASAEGIGKHPGPLRLRLALIEEEVLYASADGRDRHRHVVRATPGGANGVAMDGGKGRFETVVKLDDLRRTLHEYLSDYPRSIEFRDAFRGTPPEIALKGLSIVAFVRNDDGEVLHAVIVAVPDR